MRLYLTLSICILCSIIGANGAKKQEKAALEEEFGYVTVRTGAHMFWVMYHTELSDDYTEAPLILWLQGGPGASGVGYGNFMELGPYDLNGNLRPGRWTLKANLMFIDNPVGTGYSYVENYNNLATDNKQIADDLVEAVKGAFSTNPDMENMHFYVYCESYGGKMAIDFALAFDQAIKNGDVKSNFMGVALGDSWISPMDSVNTWGPYLYQMGFVNKQGQASIDNAAADTQAEVDAGNWDQATNEWSYTEYVVLSETDGVNFYNVLAEDDIYLKKRPHLPNMNANISRLYENHVLKYYGNTRDALDNFMNGAQKTHWNIPSNVVWDSQGGAVFSYLSADFMKPVVDSVKTALEDTDILVTVFTGDLDLICDTPGTYKWIDDMDWSGKASFDATSRQSISISAYSAVAAYLQKSGNFAVFTILRSGHMVPIDAPEMALKMIDMINGFGKEKSEKKIEKENHASKESSSKIPVHKEHNPTNVKTETAKKIVLEKPKTKPVNKVEKLSKKLNIKSTPVKKTNVKKIMGKQSAPKSKKLDVKSLPKNLRETRGQLYKAKANPVTPTGRKLQNKKFGVAAAPKLK